MSRPDFEVLGSTVYATQKIVEYLKPLLEGTEREIDKVQTVEHHLGRFDKAEDVKRWMSQRDGGVRIAALRVSEYEKVGGRLYGNVSFAAYVFTSDQFGYEKGQRAEVIAGSLVKHLMLSTGIDDEYSAPSNFRSDNMYSGSIDELGVAVWAVTWSQWWPLDVALDADTLDRFLRFGFKVDMGDGSPEMEGLVDVPQTDS